jgi:hypothetical protein
MAHACRECISILLASLVKLDLYLNYNILTDYTFHAISRQKNRYNWIFVQIIGPAPLFRVLHVTRRNLFLFQGIFILLPKYIFLTRKLFFVLKNKFFAPPNTALIVQSKLFLLQKLFFLLRKYLFLL